MSTGNLSPELVRKTMPQYRPGAGNDRYVRFCREILQLRLGTLQERLLKSLEENRRTLAVTGNGVGKSYGGGAAGGIAALYCNPNCTVNVTSGSYGQLEDTIWKPLKSLHRNSQLPGRMLDNTRELRTGLDEEWYLKCLSPQYPADLEGRHNERMVYIIEEADKPNITHEHIDSAGSTLTDASDRMLVIANPPQDETDVVYDLMQSENWHTVSFSSLNAHNIKVDAGEIDAEKIPGLVELDEIRENWEAWNAEDWPGLEQARKAHQQRDDLDTRWYRRRAGVMPPAAAGVHRPFTIPDVNNAYDESERTPLDTEPAGLSLDVARMGGDSNAIGAVNEGVLSVIESWDGVDHNQNEANVRATLGDNWSTRFAVDAQGEGSGLADRIDTFYPDMHRFDAGAKAADVEKFYDNWAEGLYHLGQFIQDGGTVTGRRLREELLAAARVVEFEEKFYASRDASVLKATKKDDLKDQLGRSPDALDAAMMAVWSAEVELNSREPRDPDSCGVSFF